MSSSPAPEAAPPARGWFTRRDSLQLRLLVAQGLALLAIAALLGVLFYVERNVAIARLYAARWGGPITTALSTAAAVDGVTVQATEPQPSHRPWQLAPRFGALHEAFTAQGLVLHDLRVQLRAGPQGSGLRLWLLASVGQATPRWVGLDARPLLPEWSGRVVLALALGLGCLGLLSWTWARWLSRPLEELHGLIAGPPGAARPQALHHAVPEIRAIAAAHQALQERLAQQARERAVMLAGVSHDLRSPLGRIRLAAELLPDEPALRPRKAAIARNVAQADRLVESFLDHVRAGELPLDQTVDLAAVARHVAAGMERPAAELLVEAPATLPWPHAHPLLVERLIANLVDNAFQHGLPPVHVQVQLQPDGSARLRVRDAGPGIPGDQVALLQEAFTRGDRARSRAGSGLGLAIVRQVVQRLGGEVSLAPATPQGLCVSVTLPRRHTP